MVWLLLLLLMLLIPALVALGVWRDAHRTELSAEVIPPLSSLPGSQEQHAP